MLDRELSTYQSHSSNMNLGLLQKVAEQKDAAVRQDAGDKSCTPPTSLPGARLRPVRPL